MSGITAEQKTKLLELTRMKYEDQAKWFLNGFWTDIEPEAEAIWKCGRKFMELDQRKKEGNELDEFQAHKFLETLGETLTVVQLRETLRKVDADANGKMALLEYLTFRYSKTVQSVIDAPQGSNKEELDEAQARLQAVQDALAEVQVQSRQQELALQEQRQALEESKVAAAASAKAAEDSRVAAENAKSKHEEQKLAEETVRKAESDLRNAVDDLNNQETTYHTQIAALDAKSKDTNLGTVSRSKAAAELAQMKQEDPLPLRKAKISQEAALRKVEKERKAAEQATANAANAAHQAEEAAKAAENAAEAAKSAASEAEEKTAALEEQKKKVEEAVRETEARLKEALDYLEEVKKKGGIAYGAVWWMERELKEAQKYLPKKKQQAVN